MKVTRMVMLAAAFMAAATLPALAQGRGGAQRPAKVTTAARPTTPKAPKADAAARTPKAPPANKPASPGANRADGAKADAAAGGARSGRGDMTIAEKIAANPQQKARIEAMLPPGMSLEDAASGFRNDGQFRAALEASKNHDIDFAALKTEMTGDAPISLGEAIQKLKPATSTTATTPAAQ